MTHTAENDAARIITVSPVEWAEMIREAQARAWDEGWEYGGALGASPKSDNPYRPIPPEETYDTTMLTPVIPDPHAKVWDAEQRRWVIPPEETREG